MKCGLWEYAAALALEDRAVAVRVPDDVQPLRSRWLSNLALTTPVKLL